MAELRTLARPYAKAAFQSANETSQVQAWSEQLNALAALCQQDKVAELLASSAIEATDKASRLAGLLGDDLQGAQQNFLSILAEYKRLPLLPAIAELFEELKAAQEQLVEVNISTAFALPADSEQKLVDALKQKLQREVRVQTQVDSALLGGVLVRAGDVVIDGSVKGRLGKLAEAVAS